MIPHGHHALVDGYRVGQFVEKKVRYSKSSGPAYCPSTTSTRSPSPVCVAVITPL